MKLEVLEIIFRGGERGGGGVLERAVLIWERGFLHPLPIKKS